MHETLIEFVSRELLDGRAPIELTPDDDLLGSGLVDSVGMMRLISFVEEHYEARIPPEDVTIDNFMTVRAIASYLEERLAS